jgi:hypothetical protein
MDADRAAAPAPSPTPTSLADTADVAWSKLGVNKGGVGAKRGRRATRGRGKGRGARPEKGGVSKEAALYFGNPKKGKLRKSIFTRVG